MPTTSEVVLEIGRRNGLIRPRDLTAAGLPHTLLYQLERQGRLERVARGIYRLPDQEYDQDATLAEVCKRVPGGVVCLLSALRYHDLGTQAPLDVWVAIDGKARAPKVETPRVRYVRLTGVSLSSGVEEHPSLDGPVRVYSVAKTVVDCFKFRNKVGLDVALEALQDCLRHRRATVDELWTHAKALRMVNVMRPYLEASV